MAADDPWERIKNQDSSDITGSITDLPKLVTDKLNEAQQLIDQLNSLYNLFFSGVEKRPPVEKRRMLDRVMKDLQNAPKPTPVVRFRWGSVNASYLTHRERWDRQLKAREKT